jgi:phosphonate transport system substrate-binding protein
MVPVKSGRTLLRLRNTRRLFLRSALALGSVLPAVGAHATVPPLRFGTTPVFLNEQVAMLGRWRTYLETRLARPVQFVQRGSYREIVDLLLNDSIDAAWLCGHPFVLYESRLAVSAVPRYRGAPLYRSYLIVPMQDAATASITDLRGRVFAYSDPLSNSGYLVPRAELVRAGVRHDGFFRRTFFTFGHRKVIEAVRSGLADGGAVDGYVWDTLAIQQPSSVAGVKVVWRSEPHGFPPVVVRRNGLAGGALVLGAALRDMSDSEAGRAILGQLNLDGFSEPVPGQFDSIRALLRIVDASRT